MLPGRLHGERDQPQQQSNHSVVIVASRDPNTCISAGGPCGERVAGGDLQPERDPDALLRRRRTERRDLIIHMYSGREAPPPRRRSQCNAVGWLPTDDSRLRTTTSTVPTTTGTGVPYLTAHVDFGTAAPIRRRSATSARRTSSTGSGALSYVSGDTWLGTYTLPNNPVGALPDRRLGTGHKDPARPGQLQRRVRERAMRWGTSRAHMCPTPNKSDPTKYLTLVEHDPGHADGTHGNSYPKTPNAQVQVTVAFVPPLKDTPISDSPIKLLFLSPPVADAGARLQRQRHGPERVARTDGLGLPRVPGERAQRKLRDALPGPG